MALLSCAHAASCPGCPSIALTHAEQLTQKRRAITSALTPYGAGWEPAADIFFTDRKDYSTYFGRFACFNKMVDRFIPLLFLFKN